MNFPGILTLIITYRSSITSLRCPTLPQASTSFIHFYASSFLWRFPILRQTNFSPLLSRGLFPPVGVFLDIFWPSAFSECDFRPPRFSLQISFTCNNPSLGINSLFNPEKGKANSGRKNNSPAFPWQRLKFDFFKTYIYIYFFLIPILSPKHFTKWWRFPLEY